MKTYKRARIDDIYAWLGSYKKKILISINLDIFIHKKCI